MRSKKPSSEWDSNSGPSVGESFIQPLELLTTTVSDLLLDQVPADPRGQASHGSRRHGRHVQPVQPHRDAQ